MLRAELQETRDKYLLLYDFSPNGYLTLNSAGRILEANLTISAMLGIDKSSLPGEFFYKFLTAGSRNLFEPHLKAVLNGALKGEIEIRLKRKDGSHLPVKVESIAVRDSRGILSQCYLTITDISQIKKTQELERLHKTVMELSGQAVFVTIVTCKSSNGIKSLKGISAGKHMRSVCPPVPPISGIKYWNRSSIMR